MRRIAIGVVVGALVLAGCGGGSDDDGNGPDAAENEERPEGPWAFVRTQLERSDAPDLNPGLSIVLLGDLDPSCGDGPCDIEMTPDGIDGTYLPDGLVVANPAPPDPLTLAWDETASTYTIDYGKRESSCTTAEGEIIEDAYRLSTIVTGSFVPPEDGAPARFEGTYERTAEQTPAGETGGCTSYDESGSFVGSPAGALDDVDLTGTYTTTEYVAATEPAGERPPGFAGLLPPMTTDHKDDTLSVRGVVGTSADLKRTDARWSGSTGEVSGPCTATSTVVDGNTSVETWTDLAAVAMTPDGEPILAGEWSIAHKPTSAGSAAGCQSSSNTGYIVMVPAASLE